MIKKNILMALFGLLLAGCNSGASYPSDSETVLRKGIEALNEKNLKDVNRYFDLQDWDEVLQYKDGTLDDSEDDGAFGILSPEGMEANYAISMEIDEDLKNAGIVF